MRASSDPRRARLPGHKFQGRGDRRRAPLPRRPLTAAAVSKPRLAKFKRMIAAIKAGDWDRAAIEALDSRWAARSATAPPKSPRCCAAILPVLSDLIIFAVQRVDDRDHQGH